MAELLLELYSEEIPPSLQIGARDQLKFLIENSLKEKELNLKPASLFIAYEINLICSRYSLKNKNCCSRN